MKYTVKVGNTIQFLGKIFSGISMSKCIKIKHLSQKTASIIIYW